LCRPTATRPVDKHVALRLVRLVARRPLGGNSGPAMTEPRPPFTPSPPLGAERVGVRWGIPERSPTPTSPSRRCATGPSLSALKGGEGLYGRLRPVWHYARDAAFGCGLVSQRLRRHQPSRRIMNE